MSTKILLAVLMLTVLSATVQAAPLTREAAAAEDAFQEGLYLQRTVGNLDAALQAYDRALQAGELTAPGALVESVLLRRAEAERWRGRSAEVKRNLAALEKKDAGADVLGLARLFPPQFDLLLQVKLSDLMVAPLLKGLKLDGELKSDQIQKVQQALGFDPLKDVVRLTIGAVLPEESSLALNLGQEQAEQEGDAGAAKDEKGAGKKSRQAQLRLGTITEHFLVVAEGKLQGFKPERLAELAKGSGGKVSTERIQGTEVLVLELPPGKDDPKKADTFAVARLDDGVVVLGDPESVRGFLDARAGQTAGLKDNPKLNRIASRVPADATVWLVASPEKVLGAVQGMGGVLKLGDSPLALDGLLLTARFTKDLVVTATASAGDTHSAQLLGDIARGLVALAQFAPIEEAAVRDLLKSLKVDTQDREVRISATLPGELFKKVEVGASVEEPEETVISLSVGGTMHLTFPDLEKVVIGNTAVADVKPKGNGELLLLGNGQGTTTMLTIQKNGVKRTATVRVSVKGAADSGSHTEAEHVRLVLKTGEHRMLAIKGLEGKDISRVIVGDPKVADVQAGDGPEKIKITGIAPGKTTAVVLRKGGDTVRVEIVVLEK